MDAVPTVVSLTKTAETFAPANDRSLSLNGAWQLIEDGADWSTAISALVPGSIHLARQSAGAYGDPYFARNDQLAKKDSFRDWRMRRTFVLDAATASTRLRLEFGGVCHACRVTLNGRSLGPKHVGMFGGPDYEVTGLVTAGTNTLEVWLERAPFWPPSKSFWAGPADNGAWRTTVAFNCCYGWHYAQIPALGIWQDVRIRPIPAVAVEEPFVSTVSTNGTMDFFTVLRGRGAFKGTLQGEIRPANFNGTAQTFSIAASGLDEQRVRLRFTIDRPRLWWPNGLGEQNLYDMSLRFTDDHGVVTDGRQFTFGIRTIETRPAGRNGRPSTEQYNWLLVINGRPIFIKGTGWCTMDALMRFTRDRYERFLGAAKRQHVNFIRAWGGGLVETDDFYDFCDRYGICVMQEWPTAWDSYRTQPAAALEETVVRGVKRLRNRASLVYWCGGNEGNAPLEGKVETLNLLGRRTLELDGTRPWHRQESDNRGSKHPYVSSWGRKNPAATLTLESTFLGEFGIDCYPCLESIRRYTPDAEWNELERTKGQAAWHIDPDGAVAHHTPKFNTRDDVERLQQHVTMFLPTNSLENVVIGSQIAQAIGVRHTLERARTRFPDCTGASMYKLNDVYPAASWATVDWYGVEKYASFVVADAFAPLTAIARLERLRSDGKPLEIPLYVVDDADELAHAGSWQVSLRAYDAKLQIVKRLDISGKGSVERLRRLGEMKLTAAEASSVPLWIVADVAVDGALAGRNFYYVNFEAKQGSLFDAPPTTVEMTREGDVCVFRNTGTLPAVNVHFVCPNASYRFIAEDNWFWLEPGETKRIRVNDPAAIENVNWWNRAPMVRDAVGDAGSPTPVSTVASPTKVMLFFDTEDYTCDKSNDAIRDLAKILTEEGVVGEFNIVGLLAREIVRNRRQDVIDALKGHAIGTQTYGHSLHPTICEMTDMPDYGVAYRNILRAESMGVGMLEAAFGLDHVDYAVPPGNSWTYAAFYAYADMGMTFLGGSGFEDLAKSLDGLAPTGNRHWDVWYCNLRQIPYSYLFAFEDLLPLDAKRSSRVNIDKLLDKAATRDAIVWAFHPHMAIHKGHWDGPNYARANLVEWGHWKHIPEWPEEVTQKFYRDFRAFVRRVKADKRFVFTNTLEMKKTIKPRVAITRREIPAIRRALAKRLGPIHEPASWSVADVFQAAVAMLRGEASHLPSKAYGFLARPQGVKARTTVSAADLKAAAASIDLAAFIPPAIKVGDQTIGPADFLHAALEVLETGARTVSLAPREQLGDFDDVPGLKDVDIYAGWPIHAKTMNNELLNERLKLQLWTLRFE